VYLLPLCFGPYYSHAAPAAWILTGLVIALTAALFLRGFRAQGAESAAIIATLFALGCAFGPHNQDASVFFVYGAAFIGLRAAKSFPAEIAAYCAGILIAAALLHFPLPVWTVGVTLALAVGFAVSKSVEHRRLHHELLRVREEVEQLAKVAERERIARDLHDTLGHTLTLIAIKSELAARLAPREPLRSSEEIGEVARVAREALQELRATVSGYRDTGLVAEIEHARTLLENAGLTVDTDVAALRIEPRKETVLALALREAVTNVVRHAQAKHVRVRLRGDAEAYRLEILDDGVGGTSSDGNGLAGMRERVGAYGGSVSRNGVDGTCLAISLPSGEGQR
jgi:two-component system sensor histidine kinase DesK